MLLQILAVTFAPVYDYNMKKELYKNVDEIDPW